MYAVLVRFSPNCDMLVALVNVWFQHARAESARTRRQVAF